MNSANARFLLNWVSFEKSSISNRSSNVQNLRCNKINKLPCKLERSVRSSFRGQHKRYKLN